MKDYYKILQVEKTATLSEIKKSYRNLAKKYHPDANTNNPSAKEVFQDVSEAYAVLGDEEKRSTYDQTIGNKTADQNNNNNNNNSTNTNNETKNYNDVNFNDISKMNNAFESFFGFDPKTKEVHLNKQKKSEDHGAMKTTDLFEKFFGKK